MTLATHLIFISIMVNVMLVLGLQMQLGYSQPPAINDSSANISTPTDFFDRTGECLSIEDSNERNECFDQIIEDEGASGGN